MPKPVLIALLVSSCTMAGCGGGTPPDSPAPAVNPAEQAAPAQPPPPAETSKPPEMPAAPPNNVGPALTPPPQPAAPTAKPAPPARPAYTRTDLQIGTGREAVKGRRLSVNYTGWLYDPTKPDLKGRMFDSSQG